MAPAVIAAGGDDAIVDWVLLELRDAADPTVILASRSVLVQRDGDVVDLDGTSPVSVALTAGNYYLAVRHRNHLGCMSATPVAIGAAPFVFDFTRPLTAVHGIEARKSVAGAFPAEVLWVGDVSFDGVVMYTGEGNDRDPILFAVGGVVPTNTVAGYRQEDTNLDGTVRYTGENNDRDRILQMIGGVVPTNTRVEQLP